MNWEEIKEKYPKAWNNLVEYDWKAIYIKADLEFPSIPSQGYNNRDLYDFFDANQIYIELVRASDWWYYLGCLKAHDTRTEAEEGAFIEAFKMLERKLNK